MADKIKERKFGLHQTLIGVAMIVLGFWFVNDTISIQLVSLTKAFAKGAMMMEGAFLILWGFREIIGGIIKHGR